MRHNISAAWSCNASFLWRIFEGLRFVHYDNCCLRLVFAYAVNRRTVIPGGGFCLIYKKTLILVQDFSITLSRVITFCMKSKPKSSSMKDEMIGKRRPKWKAIFKIHMERSTLENFPCTLLKWQYKLKKILFKSDSSNFQIVTAFITTVFFKCIVAILCNNGK